MHPLRPTLYLAMTAVALVSIGALSLSDQGVRFPDGSLLTSAHNEKDIAIPVGSLFRFTNTVVTSGKVLLASSGNSGIKANWVVPADHEPGTDLSVYLHLYNPDAVCQVRILTDISMRYRSGLPAVQVFFNGISEFPPFVNQDSTEVNEYHLEDVGAGDAVTFSWFRSAEDGSDSCVGAVEVVGVNVRYTRS